MLELSASRTRWPVNFALLVFLAFHTRQAVAQDVVPVLRGRALEIVDDRGRIRASIAIYPADPTVKMPDGTIGILETVLLRLMSPKGRPNVKMGASDQGSGLGLAGESDPTYVQILAQDQHTSLKLTNSDGHEQLVKP